MWWQNVNKSFNNLVRKHASKVMVCSTSSSLYWYHGNINCDTPESNTQSFPIYRKADVAKHKSKETRIFVTFKDGVYDITDFIVNHPGGHEKILLAAGSSLEPFWQIYQQHYNSKTPLNILESLRVGTLHPDDLIENNNQLDANDPYSKDPKLSPILLFHQKKPVNAEPPRTIITDNWVTPTNLWFVRNHHPVPDMKDIKSYNIQIAGINEETQFSIDDLKIKFPKHIVTSTIQCGGNRRYEMNKVALTNGSPWDIGAISTAEWAGVRLSDVLNSLNINYDNAEKLGIKHVQFLSIDGLEASIPIRKALDKYGEVLLAYEMNGTEIPKAHGYPIRLIVPGHVGVRNVKWVSKITLSHEEAHGPWQRGMAYKGLPPSARTLEGIDVEKIPSLQEQPVQSAITFPQEGSILYAGMSNTVKGYAYSGGGRGIVRVDVSVDGGKTWGTASLTNGSEQPIDKAWAWTFWEYDFDVPEGVQGSNIQIVVKATDASYNVQPDSVDGIWNLRGINNNAWHKVTAKVQQDE